MLTPSSSRPTTPISLSKSGGRKSATPPPPKSSTVLSSPLSRPLYSRPVRAASDYLTTEKDDEYDDEDEDTHYVYNENIDEDEFGLPSISSMRRGGKRIPRSRGHDPGGGSGGLGNGISLLSIGQSKVRERANSSDIAEERGPPDYPSAKRGEGKILRPQYKDILRGS